MPDARAYNYDWDAIRVRYESGEAPSVIAKDPACPSKQAIYQRIRKERWRVADGQLPVGVRIKPDLLECLKVVQREVLIEIAQGATQKEAAGIAGIRQSTISDWKKGDENFATAFDAAIAVKIRNRRTKIEQSNDTKDARWLLERDPHSREDWGAPANVGVQINRNNIWNSLGDVHLGIPRQGDNAKLIED